MLELIIEKIKRDWQVFVGFHEGPKTTRRDVLLSNEQLHKLFTAKAALLEDGDQMDWEHSLVDRMKVLGLPFDEEGRKRLARDLRYHGVVDGSAESNEKLNDLLMSAVRHGIIK